MFKNLNFGLSDGINILNRSYREKKIISMFFVLVGEKRVISTFQYNRKNRPVNAKYEIIINLILIKYDFK